MNTKHQRHLYAIKLMLISAACFIGLAMALVFIEIHRHETLTTQQINAKIHALQTQQRAFEQHQREALSYVINHEILLTHNVHVLASEVSTLSQGVSEEMISTLKQANTTTASNNALPIEPTNNEAVSIQDQDMTAIHKFVSPQK